MTRCSTTWSSGWSRACGPERTRSSWRRPSRGSQLPSPQHFDVSGSASTAVAVPGDRYSLTALGPNGFRREFEGSLAGAAAALAVRTGVDAGGHQRRRMRSSGIGTRACWS
ncbi:hypothetical protein [Rhodococcus sp. NPDC058523]|uniref:hypothetical protein n=1 Tax=unclassified Rhodococcus (in: high G+C Gram-positive bacteria) TaxID=192944 RepID=UPI003654004B